MTTYCVTFRVADQTVGGRTYSERRQSIIDAVYSSDGYWEETTSFILASSALDTNSFAAKAAGGLSEAHDMLVAFDPADMSVAYFGAIKRADVLATFFRYVKKLP